MTDNKFISDIIQLDPDIDAETTILTAHQLARDHDLGEAMTIFGVWASLGANLYFGFAHAQGHPLDASVLIPNGMYFFSDIASQELTHKTNHYNEHPLQIMGSSAVRTGGLAFVGYVAGCATGLLTRYLQ